MADPTPAVWASSTDVLALWIGPKKPTDAAQVQLFCDIAKSIIVGEFPTIQERMDADANLTLRAKLVVVQQVQGLYKNPEMLKYFQSSTGPFLNAGNPSEQLLKMMALTDDQRSMLTPATKHRGGMVDMDPSPTLVFGGWDLTGTL